MAQENRSTRGKTFKSVEMSYHRRIIDFGHAQAGQPTETELNPIHQLQMHSTEYMYSLTVGHLVYVRSTNGNQGMRLGVVLGQALAITRHKCDVK